MSNLNSMYNNSMNQVDVHSNSNINTNYIDGSLDGYSGRRRNESNYSSRARERTENDTNGDTYGRKRGYDEYVNKEERQEKYPQGPRTQVPNNSGSYPPSRDYNYNNNYNSSYGNNYNNNYNNYGDSYGNSYGGGNYGDSYGNSGYGNNYGSGGYGNGNYGKNYDNYNNYNNYNDYRPQRPYQQQDRSQTYRPKTKDDYKDKKDEPVQETEPPEKLLIKYEEALSKLNDNPTLDEISVDSNWGVKPRGFENVSSHRAKLSGLFPLPGYPRPVDFTKLEGIVKDRISDGNDILSEASKINPNDSRLARLLIVHDNFDQIDYLKLVDYVNKQIAKIDTNVVSENNIESKFKTRDNKTLIMELKNNQVATMVLAMNGTKVRIDGDNIVLNFQRPNGYIAQGFKDDEADKTTEVQDSAFKLTIKTGEEYEVNNISPVLEKYGSVGKFQLLTDKYSKQSIGIGFVEYKFDETDTQLIILKLQTIISQLDKEDIINSVEFSCIIPEKTTIQSKPSDFENLQLLVKNEFINTNKKSKVIQLINVVTAKDLMNDDNFKFIHDDISQEVSKFGPVNKVKIPRPANDFTPGLSQFSEPGLGKVFIEFNDENVAFKAILGLAGRCFNDRIVLCSYYDAEDFKLGIF